MGKSTLTTISVFAIAFLVTVLGFFLLDIEQVALNFWALGSLLFSLVVSLFASLTIVIPRSNRSGVFYIAGLNSAIGIYQVLVVISIIFTNLFKGHLGTFILLQVVLNALFFIAMIIIICVSGYIHNMNRKTQEKVQNGEYREPKRGGY